MSPWNIMKLHVKNCITDDIVGEIVKVKVVKMLLYSSWSRSTSIKSEIEFPDIQIKIVKQLYIF